jgi:hypothetical protein
MQVQDALAYEARMDDGPLMTAGDDDIQDIVARATSPMGYLLRLPQECLWASEIQETGERLGIRTVPDVEPPLTIGARNPDSGSADADILQPIESQDPRCEGGVGETAERPGEDPQEQERRLWEARIRQDEREAVYGRFISRRTAAIEEARRAWTALARREGVLRSTVATHNRMLGRTDILYDPWRDGRETTPAFSQAELRDIRTNVQGMIYQQDVECDRLMSWERFQQVLQCYDYSLTQGE